MEIKTKFSNKKINREGFNRLNIGYEEKLLQLKNKLYNSRWLKSG